MSSLERDTSTGGSAVDPDPWPQELTETFERSITCEYASLTRGGAPVTVPSTPYVGGGTLDVSTGLAYPAKAERARRNPKVALLFADAIGAAAGVGPVVLVQGHAAVRDADLQENTDRYVRLATRKLPAAGRRASRRRCSEADALLLREDLDRDRTAADPVVGGSQPGGRAKRMAKRRGP